MKIEISLMLSLSFRCAQFSVVNENELTIKSVRCVAISDQFCEKRQKSDKRYGRKLFALCQC